MLQQNASASTPGCYKAARLWAPGTHALNATLLHSPKLLSLCITEGSLLKTLSSLAYSCRSQQLMAEQEASPSTGPVAKGTHRLIFPTCVFSPGVVVGLVLNAAHRRGGQGGWGEPCHRRRCEGWTATPRVRSLPRALPCSRRQPAAAAATTATALAGERSLCVRAYV